MNNRYLYRAKRVDNGEWVEGYLYMVNDVPYILPHYNTGQPIHVDNLLSTAVLVEETTICQCTGRRDEDKKLIFEHAIVAFLDATSTENGWSESYQVGEVLWDDETLSFQITERLSAESYEVLGDCDCKVLGNSFDNPKLLEVEE